MPIGSIDKIIGYSQCILKGEKKRIKIPTPLEMESLSLDASFEIQNPK